MRLQDVHDALIFEANQRLGRVLSSGGSVTRFNVLGVRLLMDAPRFLFIGNQTNLLTVATARSEAGVVPRGPAHADLRSGSVVAPVGQA